MEVTNIFNASTKETTMLVKSELFRQYYDYFLGLFNIGKKKYSKKFQGLSLVKDGCNAVKIVIAPSQVSIPLNSIFDNFPIFDGEKSGPKSIPLPINEETLSTIDSLIYKFLELVEIDKNKNTEFIPLEGYDTSNLQNEIEDAVKNKRSLLIVDTFDNYLRETRKKCDQREYNQYFIEYGTNEYADAALLIKEGNLEKLAEMYRGKLSLTPWL